MKIASVRNAELAKIHIAKKELSLDEDTYRSMLWTVARVRSSKDLDGAGRKRLLDHLAARGFKGEPKRRRAGRPHNISTSKQLQKIEALLTDASRAWAYVDAMCVRMFQVDRVTFANPDQLQRLVAALTYDQRRRKKRAVRTAFDAVLPGLPPAVAIGAQPTAEAGDAPERTP
jgi:phage gp16-like protein